MRRIISLSRPARAKLAANKAGFTIIELLLATAVFSLVLLGALSGFLQTGRLFYRGVSITETQAVARQIIDDVSINFQNSSVSKFSSYTSPYDYYCIGNVRYTYNPFIMVDFSQNQTLSPGGNFGLLRQNISSCVAPTGSSGASPLTGATEMLGDRMRVSNFAITHDNQLFTVNITIAYGDNTSLSGSGTKAPMCMGNSQNQQFCAVSSLSTSVFTEF